MIVFRGEGVRASAVQSRVRLLTTSLCQKGGLLAFLCVLSVQRFIFAVLIGLRPRSLLFYQDNYYKFHHLVSIASPCYCYLVGSESLCHPRIFKFCFFLGCEILQNTSVGNHCTIIYCVSLVDSSHFSSTLFYHCFDHLLKAFVAAHSTNYYHFFRATVAHCSFCDLYKHCEDGLLQGKAKIRKC